MAPRLCHQILLGKRWEPEEPQHGVGNSLQNIHPDAKNLRPGLVELSKVEEDELVLLQAKVLPRLAVAWVQDVPRALLVVVDEVRVRHVNERLRVVLARARGRWNARLIRDKVVDPVGSCGPTEPEKRYLDRRRTKSEDLVTRALGVNVEVDQDVAWEGWK